MTLEENFIRIVDQRAPVKGLWSRVKMHYHNAGDNLKQALKKQGLEIKYDKDMVRVRLVDKNTGEVVASADPSFLHELEEKDYFGESLFGDDTGIDIFNEPTDSSSNETDQNESTDSPREDLTNSGVVKEKLTTGIIAGIALFGGFLILLGVLLANWL